MTDPTPAEVKITQAELAEIFGPMMPLEAWQIIADPKPGVSLAEVRAELRRIAALSPPDAGEVRTYREGVEASAALVDQAEQMYRGGSGGSYKECRRNQCELIAAAIRKLP